MLVEWMPKKNIGRYDIACVIDCHEMTYVHNYKNGFDIDFRGFYLNDDVKVVCGYMGLLWAILNATLVGVFNRTMLQHR